VCVCFFHRAFSFFSSVFINKTLNLCVLAFGCLVVWSPHFDMPLLCHRNIQIACIAIKKGTFTCVLLGVFCKCSFEVCECVPDPFD
jgi:hypothetical protein